MRLDACCSDSHNEEADTAFRTVEDVPDVVRSLTTSHAHGLCALKEKITFNPYPANVDDMASSYQC